MSAIIEPLPQRQLMLELRFQIDHARRHPKEASQTKTRIRALIAAHPRGIISAHVHRNLGQARRRWLAHEGLLGPKVPVD